MLQRCAARLANRTLSAGWLAWLAWVASMRSARRALGHFKNRALAAAYKKFEENWRDARALRACEFGDKGILRRYMRKWRDFVPISRSRKEKERRAGLMAFGTVTRRAWTAWLRTVVVMRKVARLMGSSRGRKSGHIFREWRNETLISKSHRVLSRSIVQRNAAVLTAGIWRVWRHHARADGHWRLRTCGLAFRGWRSAAGFLAAQKHKLRMALGVIGHGFQYRTFVAWRDIARLMFERRERFFHKQQALRRALLVGDETLRRRRKELVYRIFGKWRQHRRQMRMVNNKFVGKLAGMTRRCLAEWIKFTDRKINNKRKRAAAVALHRETWLRKPLLAWRDEVIKARRLLASKLEDAIGLAFMTGCVRALRRWKLFVGFRQRRRDKLCDAFRVVFSVESAERKERFFKSWASWAANKGDREAQSETAAQRHFRQKQLDAVFSVWSAYTQASPATLNPPHTCTLRCAACSQVRRPRCRRCGCLRCQPCQACHWRRTTTGCRQRGARRRRPGTTHRSRGHVLRFCCGGWG